jgi:hypothetical protein
LVVVNEDGNTAIGVETEEPLLLLLVGGDVTTVMSVCCSWKLEVRGGDIGKRTSR